jgi:hypothetical protein
VHNRAILPVLPDAAFPPLRAAFSVLLAQDSYSWRNLDRLGIAGIFVAGIQWGSGELLGQRTIHNAMQSGVCALPERSRGQLYQSVRVLHTGFSCQ